MHTVTTGPPFTKKIVLGQLIVNRKGMKKGMAITIKKRLFAEAKNKGLSNTESAVCAGYSAKTAPQAGSRLAKDPDVIKLQIALKSRVVPKVKKKEGGKMKARDPKEVLIELLDDPDPAIQLKSAQALMPYMHARVDAKAPVGKKEQAKADAQKATASGRFATLAQQVDAPVGKIQ